MDDNKFNKLDGKIDRLDDRLDKIDVTLAKQSVILEEHQRRSLANEKAVEVLAANFNPVRDEFIKIKTLTSWLKVLIGSGFILEFIKLGISYFK